MEQLGLPDERDSQGLAAGVCLGALVELQHTGIDWEEVNVGLYPEGSDQTPSWSMWPSHSGAANRAPEQSGTFLERFVTGISTSQHQAVATPDDTV